MLRDSPERRECSQSQVKNYSSRRWKPVSTQNSRKCDTKPNELYNLPLEKGRPCPEPHKATDNWRSKVLGFLSQLHEMQCVGLHGHSVTGLQMFKVTSLDSRRTWIPRCRSPCALERTKTTWNDLVTLLRATQQPRRDTRKRKKAVDGN